MLKIIVSILVPISLMSCVTFKPVDPYINEMRWLQDADPHEDVRRAFAMKDFRFKGMNNHGNIVVPISPDGLEKLYCKNWKTDVDVIGGTDNFQSYETKKLDVIGYIYSGYYNSVVWNYWIEKYAEHVYSIKGSYEQLDIDTIYAEVGEWKQCVYIAPTISSK